MKELNHLLSLSPRGLSLSFDGDAMNERLYEWFENPMYTVADNPAWGNNLSPFQFSPQDASITAAIEMSIVEKLPIDVDGLSIRGVRAAWRSIDLVHIMIEHNYGDFEYNLSVGVSS